MHLSLFMFWRSLVALVVLCSALSARPRYEDYALILEGPPLAEQVGSVKELHSAAARERLQSIEAAQDRLKRELARRKIAVVGSVQLLLNAVFVRVPVDTVSELRTLPGVKSVEWMRRMKRHLDQAVNLMNVPAAWNITGGVENAGAGVKIGVLDSGIDQAHKAFQDASLAVPDGFPKGDAAFTSNKVIVARSYVVSLALGNGTPQDTRPDDLSPRDRSGHGTAVAMIAAGARNEGPAAAITGIAPRAWLGNYKVFGTPGVNDVVSEKVMAQALDDAARDGMDIVVLPFGAQPAYGVLARDCSGICDARNFAIEQAVQNAVSAGLTVVTSAGNDGDIGVRAPTLSTVHTPGIVAEAITVGALTNSRRLYAAVRVTGDAVSSELQNIKAVFGEGPRPPAPLTASLRDVAKTGNDGRACAALPGGSLDGAIALIQRSNCDFSIKINNAQTAGAVGAVVYQSAEGDAPVTMFGLANTAIPAVMIDNAGGVALKNLTDARVTLDPTLQPQGGQGDLVTSFSSQGPTLRDAFIKPELAAVGRDIYTATQNSDPNGDLYDSSGYREVSGTSFAAAIVAGAAALVKQQHPGFSPPQIKSALVNTASQSVMGASGAARVVEVGAGKLDAGAAVASTATVDRATLSFGAVSALPVSLAMRVTNAGSDAATFNLSVAPRDADSRASVTVSPSSLTLNPGQTASVSAQLSGTRPAPGSYEGFVNISGGNTNLKVPYLYVVGDGVPFNIFPIAQGSFTGVVRDVDWLLAFKLQDRYGVAVANQPVNFQVKSGGGVITQGDQLTDKTGIAAALVNLGTQAGDQIFTAAAGGLTVEFDGYARASVPVIDTAVNATGGEAGQGLAAGSYATIRGSFLSDATKSLNSKSLPIQMAGVSVSFDAPGVSVPGRPSYVSPGQIDVQIPWELQGRTSAQMKVSLGNISSALYRVPLSDYSPGIFGAVDAAGAAITTDNPARRGQTITISANGLGAVNNQPPSGEPTPAEPLATTRVTPVVTIGGKQGEVSFSGLASSTVGKYQISVVVPADADAGMQPLRIAIGGVTSNPVMIPVR
jgi:minor extracellular serine protease Vpr